MLNLSTLKNTKITGSGCDPEGFPFLEFQNESGEGFRAFIQRDPEGNGAGFLFGLPVPGAQGSQVAWQKAYYKGAEGVSIDTVHDPVPDPMNFDDFPHLKGTIIEGGQKVEVLLEISCDEEGNSPGFLAIEKI